MPRSRTYDSTSDYCGSLMTLEMIDYLRQRDRVEDEDDARFLLFALYRSRDVVRDWVAPEYDRGPFVLAHRDFLLGNVIVNDDLRIVVIIDWECSHTSNYAKEPDRLNQAVRKTEEALSHSAQNALSQPPLPQLWQNLYENRSFCIAHALLRRTYITDVCRVHFSNVTPPDEQIIGRVAPFFESARNPEANSLHRLTQRKVEESQRFNALFDDEEARQHMIERPRSPRPPLSIEEHRALEVFVKGFEKSTESEGVSHQTRTPFSINDLHFTDYIPRSCLLRDACLLTVAGLSYWILARRWRLL
ncbi:MAG: hypothetical protein M1825_001693 [Sarcosagium campestre]|nr:MAG: hypothetical protein M1825_001693 [Sarcosagium campestre]